MENTIFKIEIYYLQTKTKRKFYESRETYEKWWATHQRWESSLPGAGMVGYADGVVDRTFGLVPENKQMEK